MDYSYPMNKYVLSVSNSKYYLFLFIIWPFLAFISALANYNQKESRRVVYLFLIYYGLTFVIANNYVDAARYAAALKENAKLPFSEFFNIVGGIYATDTSIDIIEPFLSFLISRFTSFHGVLFAVFAAIFGFFYLKSINLLYHRYKLNPGINGVVFLVYFIFLLPITNINGFRMWTAAWIFFYSAYQVIINKNRRYLILALLSSLVHFSFISANAILIIYAVLGNRNIIYFPLAAISFIIPGIVSPFLGIAARGLGGAFQSRYEGYSSENYIRAIQQSSESASWFIQLSDVLLLYYFIIVSFFIYLNNRNRSDLFQEKRLFSFMLLFLSFINFAKVIPSFGGRFEVVFFMFATLYLFLYIIKQQANKLHIITIIGIFPMLLYSLIIFRIGSESINLWMFTPVIGLPLFASGVPISEFLF